MNPQGENIPVAEQIYHHQQSDHGFFTGLLSQHSLPYPTHQIPGQIPSSKQNHYIPPPPLTQNLPNAIIASNHSTIPSAHQQPQLSSCQKTCMSGVGHYGNPNPLLHGLLNHNQQPIIYPDETQFAPLLTTNHGLTHMTLNLKPFPPSVNQVVEQCHRLPFSATVENNIPPNPVSVHNSVPYTNFTSKPEETVDNGYMEYLNRKVQKSESLDTDIIVTVLKTNPVVYLIAYERELEILKAMTIEHLKNLSYSFVSELEPHVTAISTVDDILIIPQTENNETIFKLIKVEADTPNTCPSDHIEVVGQPSTQDIRHSGHLSVNCANEQIELSSECLPLSSTEDSGRHSLESRQESSDDNVNETKQMIGELFKTTDLECSEEKSVGKLVREGLNECNQIGEDGIDIPDTDIEVEDNVHDAKFNDLTEFRKDSSGASDVTEDCNVPNISKIPKIKVRKGRKISTENKMSTPKLKKSLKNESSPDEVSNQMNGDESTTDCVKKKVKNNKKIKVKKAKEEMPVREEESVPNNESKMKIEKNNKLYCEVCECEHKPGECFLLTPHTVIEDRKSCQNSTYYPIISLPLELYLVPAEDGIFAHAAEILERGTQFGPLICQEVEFKSVERTTDLTHLWIWRDYTKDEKEGFEELKFFSSQNESKSNWCRFLRLSTLRSESNLIQIIRGDKIFFVTQKCVAKGEQLLCYVPYFDELPNRLHSDLESNFKSTNKCPKCDLPFDSFLNFVKHCRIIHPRGITRTKCECRYCGIKVNCFRELRDHAKEAHADIASFDCHICGKFLQSTSSLRSHMKGVHRQVPPSTCDICGKVFHTRSKYRSHIRDYHSSTFYKCEVCGKEFKMRACYHRHKKTHTMDFRFACDRCGKCFRDGHNLKVHLLTHSGKRPFQCSFNGCDAAFTTKQCLQIHYRKNHGCTDEKIPEITRQVPFTFEAHGISKTGETEPKKESEDSKPEHGALLQEQDFMDFVIAQHSQPQ